MTIKGRVFKYGDNVNTDVIFPGKYTYTVTDVKEQAQHSLEDLDPNFMKEMKPGDIVVAGTNFGCGSSREQAASCLKYAGLGAIVAKSFSRLYYRNAINFGLPAVVIPAEAVDAIQRGDEVEVDLEAGKVRTAGREYNFPPLPEYVAGIFKAGGLDEFIKAKMTK